MFGIKKEHQLSPLGKKIAKILDADRSHVHFEAGGRASYPYNSVPDKPGSRDVSRAFNRWALSGSLLEKNNIRRT